MGTLVVMIMIAIVLLLIYVDDCLQKNFKRLDLSKVQFMYCIYEEQKYLVVDLNIVHRFVYVLNDEGEKECLPMCKCELLIQEVRK